MMRSGLELGKLEEMREDQVLGISEEWRVLVDVQKVVS